MRETHQITAPPAHDAGAFGSTIRSAVRSVALVALVLAAKVGLAQSGGVYTIVTSTIDGGGAMFSTGGVYSVGSTIGQPDASAASALNGGVYHVTGGFWSFAAAGGLRGDVDASGVVNVADVFYLINALFAGGPPPAGTCQGDVDNNGSVTVADVFFLINYLFAGGPAPTPQC
jgi:hypothetical protein